MWRCGVAVVLHEKVGLPVLSIINDPIPIQYNKRQKLKKRRGEGGIGEC